MNISKLKIGDIVQHVESGNAYEVITNDNGRVFAVREIQISNPDEWVLVGDNPYKKSTGLTLYLAVETDLPQLINLVQSNQDFFGDPPAGASCIKLAADKLEELIKAGKDAVNQ